MSTGRPTWVPRRRRLFACSCSLWMASRPPSPSRSAGRDDVIASVERGHARRHGRAAAARGPGAARGRSAARRRHRHRRLGRPGLYTVLARAARSTADAFGLALGVPVHGVCTLDGLAFAADLEGPFVVATMPAERGRPWARVTPHPPHRPGRRPSRRHRRAGGRAPGGRRGCAAVPGHLPPAHGSRSTCPPPPWPGWPPRSWRRGRSFPRPVGSPPARRPGPQELQGGHPQVLPEPSHPPSPQRRTARDALGGGHRPRAAHGAGAVPGGRLVAGDVLVRSWRMRAGPGVPCATSSPRRPVRSSATRVWSPPGSRPTCRPSPSPATTGAPASARCC
ncbi:hypothetical protein STENM327S_04371 [Streptomyces tendae]